MNRGWQLKKEREKGLAGQTAKEVLLSMGEKNEDWKPVSESTFWQKAKTLCEFRTAEMRSNLEPATCISGTEVTQDVTSTH